MQMQVSMSQTTLYEAGPSSLRTMNSTTGLFGFPSSSSSSQKPHVRCHVHQSYHSPSRTAAHLGRLSRLGTGYKSKHDSTCPDKTRLVFPLLCGRLPSTPILALGPAWLSSQAKLPTSPPSRRCPAQYPVTCLHGIDGFTRGLDHGSGVGRVSELPRS
jgi:hypothetical protein